MWGLLKDLVPGSAPRVLNVAFPSPDSYQMSAFRKAAGVICWLVPLILPSAVISLPYINKAFQPLTPVFR
jgi:hypothetical protein